MDEQGSFGQWIKHRRIRLELNQEVLAERVGCSVQMIRKIEAGERRPSRVMAQRLALGLELPADEHVVFLNAARDGYAPPTERPMLSTVSAMRSGHSHTMPVPRDPLIGRDHDLATVTALLSRPDVGIVTLVGSGGAGKTRLALQLAADLWDSFADGVSFVDLAPLSESTFVAATIASTLAVPQVPEEQVLDSLRGFLADKHVLLLLDNFEHVVDAAPLLSELMTAAPGLKLLVTSRVVLHLTGEHEYVVPPLSLPDLPGRGQPALPPERLEQYGAVELFIRRAQRVKPDFTVTNQSALAVAEICTRLDGLPLAIELAAARCKLFTPQALLQRLDRRMELLTGGTRDKQARQQTLRNTLDWSYNLLEEREQRLFARLAVFVGGFTLEAAEVVCQEQGDLSRVLDELTSLVDKSLLRQEEDWEGGPRFRMLETIREYAWERLFASSQAEQMRQQHAAYFLALAERAESELRGRAQPTWLLRLEQEHDNLRAVLRWAIERGASETAFQLSVALATFWRVRGYSSEGRAWLARAIDLADDQLSQGLVVTDGTLRAKALLTAAQLNHDHEVQNTLLAESLQLFREFGNLSGVADTLRSLGVVASRARDNERATALLTESLAMFRQLTDARGCANALTHLAHIVLDRGDVSQAQTLYEEALTLFRIVDDQAGAAWSLIALGEVARLLDDYSMAGRYYTESLALGRELGHRSFVADALHNLGYVERYWGNHAQASAFFMESLALAQELDDQATIANCLAGLAGVMIATGNHTAGVRRAVQLLGAAESVRDRSGVPLQLVDRREWERSAAAAHVKLDEGTFAAAWAEGRALSLEQALAHAI